MCPSTAEVDFNSFVAWPCQQGEAGHGSDSGDSEDEASDEDTLPTHEFGL